MLSENKLRDCHFSWFSTNSPKTYYWYLCIGWSIRKFCWLWLDDFQNSSLFREVVWGCWCMLWVLIVDWKYEREYANWLYWLSIVVSLFRDLLFSTIFKQKFRMLSSILSPLFALTKAWSGNLCFVRKFSIFWINQSLQLLKKFHLYSINYFKIMSIWS